MRLATPVAVRSTKIGGTWEYCPHPRTRQPYFTAELGLLRTRLADVDRFLLAEELNRLLGCAERGECTYGHDRECDVEQMVTQRNVLELRFDRRASVSKREGTIEVRLYFTEPVELPDTLLELLFAWKHPGPHSTAQQNQHAKKASDRARMHVDGVDTRS